jgi:recombination protein RecR
MSPLPPELDALIAVLRRLPGVGARTAERYALAVLDPANAWGAQLSGIIADARERVRPCARCGFYAVAGSECAVCADARRDAGVLCVVETANDVLALERARVHRGRYHCLGGRLSPLHGIGPEQLAIAPLLARLAPEGVREVILALGTDVEGETTSLYLADQLRSAGIPVTRPAQGLPAGGTLDNADALTLGRAWEERRGL